VPFRMLSDEEIREAALETMMMGDWMPMRDKVLELFPSAHTFSYRFTSEFNDEGYDIRMRLIDVKDLGGVTLVKDGNLSKRGEKSILESSQYQETLKSWHGRWELDADDYFHDAIYAMDDVETKMWIEDGNDGPVIEANVRTGPSRKFSTLFVAVSE
jgi:hypothetical protein